MSEIEIGEVQKAIKAKGRKDCKGVSLMVVRENIEMIDDGTDTFIVADGVEIAKRGSHAGDAKTWVSLVPGWKVSNVDFGDSIEIKFNAIFEVEERTAKPKAYKLNAETGDFGAKGNDASAIVHAHEKEKA